MTVEGMATLYSKASRAANDVVWEWTASWGQTRKHSPQSMQSWSMMRALPSATRMARVGHADMQWTQPMHLSLVMCMAWKFRSGVFMTLCVRSSG